MNKIRIGFLTCALSLLAFAGSAYAGAIVTDGNVSLGVDDYGQLNIFGGTSSVSGTTAVGVRWIDGGGDQFESTSHGCVCEGWGVAASGASGWANNNFGAPTNLGLSSFASTATTATSVTTMGDLEVTHSFALSPDTDNLYKVSVTIRNTGAATATDVEYRRTMDWDADPTPFDEYVTINSGTSTNLVTYSNDGFTTSDPFDSIVGCFTFGIACIQDTDFVDEGPADHGANFDFNFGDLLAGESVEFSIFYGGAENTAAALAAIGAVGAEVYSFARSGCDADDDGFADFTGCGFGSDITPTYIFAFAGVGGDPVVDVAEPGTLFLLGAGLFGMGLARRRRSA